MSTLHQNPTILPPTPRPTPGITVLRARHGWQPLALAKLLRYRDLLWFLALRDIQVRYKQTVLGVVWAVLQPVVTMVVLSAFFSGLVAPDGKIGGAAYPIFLFAGLLPWTFFSAAATASSGSLVSNSNLLRKVYFPRLLIPLASLGAPLVDYAISFVVLAAMMAWYRVVPTANLLLLPLLLLTALMAALGVGILLAALTAAYRDFRFVVTFLIQIWFFITPVIYPVAVVPARLRPLLVFNPMHGTIEAFRATVLGTPINFQNWALSAITAAVSLVVGLAYFSRTERRLADVV